MSRESVEIAAELCIRPLYFLYGGDVDVPSSTERAVPDDLLWVLFLELAHICWGEFSLFVIRKRKEVTNRLLPGEDMVMTFLNDTRLASTTVLKGLGFAKDFLSIVRSFPMIYLLLTNIKAYLMVKWRYMGSRINIWVWTWLLWSIINVPWYTGVQMGRATGENDHKSTGQLLVLITFAIYTILAITSEFMYISMIWELAKMRECKPFIWILNTCEFFLYTSILSFTMGNISRLLQYLTVKDPNLPSVYSQIINAFGGDIAEAPFMMAVTFSMVILTNRLRNAEITFLAQFGDRVATEEDGSELDPRKTVFRVSRGGAGGAVIWS
ncbi:hypothetical protein HDU67_008835 [Dinochytrium kinnereticum]|nr:hypothetical protein HDU67_008835 [Dinochytrium kinnereticum]